MDVFKLFRRLIFASVLIMAANFLAIFLEPDPPEAITDYLMADGAGAYLLSLLESESRGTLLGFALLGLAFLVGWLAALAGMCFFKPWSRPLFILIAMIGFLMLPLMGT